MTEPEARTVMWEARAAEGRLDELLAFVSAAADPSAQVYRSAGAQLRVVVIDPSGRGIADVPSNLVARAPHSWPFELIPRSAQLGYARPECGSVGTDVESWHSEG